MTNRGVAVVGIRLLAVYLLIQLLLLLPQAADRWADPSRAAMPVVLTLAGGLLAAAVLWFGVSSLAGWIVPSRTAQSLAEEQAGDPVSPAGAAAFSAAGVLLAAWALPDLLAQLLSHYDAPPGDQAETLLPLAVAALRVALGLAVMLGSSGLARTIHHLRRTGAG